MAERLAIYPGSFDPITNGHVSIIERSLTLFDHVVVSVARNLSKKPLFALDERIQLVRETFASEPRVLVDTFEGLLVTYAQSCGAVAIVRGLRGVADFEYELQMNSMNRRLAPELTTVYLMAEDRHAHISSSLLKEVASLGGDIRGLVPPPVEARMLAIYPLHPETR
jgi:pantetheine-phosphate adenylyltransferase